MNNELLEKLDIVINDFNDSKEIKEFLQYKEKVLNDKDLLNKISKLKELDNNSKEYKELKEELFKNNDYKEYKHLENELYFLSLEIGNKLSSLSR